MKNQNPPQEDEFAFGSRLYGNTSGVHVTAAGFIECFIGLNVTDVVLEASCWQPVKVSTECVKATHQLGDVAHAAELLLELTDVGLLPYHLQKAQTLRELQCLNMLCLELQRWKDDGVKRQLSK